MDRLDPDLRIDIRGRVRDHGARQLAIARLRAPSDWEGSLRRAIAAERSARPLLMSSRDVRLFLESFALFFTATIMFLL
ncbi:hypothetical protein [Sphingopyxis flava]|uniref:Uncharacterized protein n=1 Tax=Sphingopyxis flava TaxID=1507287 RepID=A0A1T5BH37_9SPHN|nr:hypothetical protein [Sphingopyxis flava]SKB46320.1 hypothetical protein SAMN06295937_1006174 [Sphingopyxis flava]